MNTNIFKSIRSGMTVISFLIMLLTFTVHAQTGRVGINTITPLALLHVKDSSVLFTGPSALPMFPGNPPVNGAGTRMMWYSDKAALRVGSVTSNAWSRDSIGDFSFASGFNSVASKKYATALGQATKARGDNSTAIGRFSIASGSSSISIGEETMATNFASIAFGFASSASGYSGLAMGYGNTAYGDYSTALGYQSFAGGSNSLTVGDQTGANGINSFAGGTLSLANADNASVLGQNLEATAYSSTIFGRFNFINYAYSPDTWIGSEPLFVIGNGDDENTRSNAVTILKNGNTGIGTISPTHLLEVLGTTQLGLNGTTLQEVIKETITLNVGNIPAGATVPSTIAISGVAVGSTVYVSPSIALNNGLIIAYARVSSPGNIEIAFGNLTASPINPASMDFYVTVIR